VDEIQTLTEMETSMRRDRSAIEDAQATQKQVEERYALDTHRSRFLSDEAHQVALRDYLPPVNEAREASRRVAETGMRNAQRIRRQTENARLVVTPDEQAAAARQEPMVRRVVDTGSLDTIRDELRAAIIADDRAAMYLMATYLPGRLEKVSDHEVAQRPELGEARVEIRRMLSHIRTQLRDTSFDPVQKLATDVVGLAARVSGAEYQRRQQAEQQADIQSGRKVAWPS
jgi:hypothetical protein